MVYTDIENHKDFTDFLAETANKLDEAIISNPQLEPLMITPIEKVMRETQKYSEYIHQKYNQAKIQNLFDLEKEPEGKGWCWYSAYFRGEDYYFDGHCRDMPQRAPTVSLCLRGYT